MKYAKFGRIAGPAFIVIDGVFRAKSVIDKYNTNDPSWKREAVVQSAGFTAGMAAGVAIGAAIAFSPIGLVVGVVVGGAAAIGADIGVKVVAEIIYEWFETRS
ncbi:MAG: hypothetical protein AB2747_17625 [Candidatus Thiodiazotropha taylori]